MEKEGIFKTITRRLKRKPRKVVEVSTDTTKVIVGAHKQAVFGFSEEEPVAEGSAIKVHRYSSSGKIFIHVMFTNSLKYVNRTLVKKDPITRKTKRVEVGPRGTQYYGKGGKLLY